MRVIADAVGLDTQDYQSSQVVSSRDAIYEGFRYVLVDDEDIDAFYSDQEVYLYKEDFINLSIYTMLFIFLDKYRSISKLI